MAIGWIHWSANGHGRGAEDSDGHFRAIGKHNSNRMIGLDSVGGQSIDDELYLADERPVGKSGATGGAQRHIVGNIVSPGLDSFEDHVDSYARDANVFS